MDSERLRRLEDKQALQELLVSYAWSCDDRDWARYRSVFTDNATIDYTSAFGRSGTRDEIAAWIEVLMSGPPLEHTQHMLSNFDFTIDGDHAAGRVNYLNPDVFGRLEGRSLLFNGGIYRFEAVRTDAGWRLSFLIARILWSARGEIMTDPLA